MGKILSYFAEADSGVPTRWVGGGQPISQWHENYVSPNFPKYHIKLKKVRDFLCRSVTVIFIDVFTHTVSSSLPR